MKKDIRDILAYAWSVVCYPLFVPTWIMLLFCKVFSENVMPLMPAYTRLAVSGTALLTGIIPLLMLLLMMRLGKVQNLDVSDRQERTLPYLITLVCMIFWAIFVGLIRLPMWLCWSAYATCIETLLVMLINLKWKISVHLASMGAVTAIICSMVMMYSLNPWSFILITLLCVWLLMLARIRLEAHTPLQTVCGYLLGLIVVLIPNLIIIFRQ